MKKRTPELVAQLLTLTTYSWARSDAKDRELPWLSVKDAATRFGISESTVRKWTRRGTYKTGTGQLIRNIHPPGLCEGRPCVIHNPSEHRMREYPTQFRSDRNPPIMERICPHGVGHPDPDDLAWHASQGRGSWIGIHGCCGCCTEPGEFDRLIAAHHQSEEEAANA